MNQRPLYSTIGEIYMLICNMLDCGDEEIVAHAKTLVGARKRGSTTICGIAGIPHKRRVFLEYSVDGVDYYVCHGPELEGTIGAIPLKEAWEKNLKPQLREGQHGPELFIDRAPEDCEVEKTDDIWIIVGEHHDRTVVFTWHPGMPLEPLSKGILPTTAVKLHNGE